MASNGLIDDYTDVAGVKVPQTTATSYDAKTAAPAQAATFTGAEATTGTTTDDQLVQSRIKGIIDEKSPLSQQAATGAKQEAARRGLVNSSMAVTAGQDALYRAALPIAQQDASTVSQQARQNQSDKNQFGLANMQESNQTGRFNTAEANKGEQFNAVAANEAAKTNAGAINTASAQNQKAQLEGQDLASRERLAALDTQSRERLAALDTQTRERLAALDNQTRVQLQSMDAATRTELVNIEANYKTLMQASQSASDLYQQTVTAIVQLQNNKDMDAASRNARIGQQTQLLQSGLNLIGNMNNLNLSGLLDFSGVNAGGDATDGTRTETIPKEAPPVNPQDLNAGG